MVFESYDPRKAYREHVGIQWDADKDGKREWCLTISHKGDTVYIPIYISEEVKAENLPNLPFMEMELPPGSTTYLPHDVGATTRKMESLIVCHIYFTDMDKLDRTEFAKLIKDRFHFLTRTNQCKITQMDFMNVEDDGLFEESDGRRVVFHYVATLYCLYYDICIE